MSIKCILFDLDGTLLNTLGDIANNLNRALSKNSFPTHSTQKVVSFINHGAMHLVKSAMPEDVTDAQVMSVFKDYQNFYLHNLTENTFAYEGIYELIKELKNMNLMLGIISNKPDTHTKPIAAHFFGNSFDYVSGSFEDAPKKPDVSVVSTAADALGVNISEMILVGDSTVDVRTAKNAGISSIGVLYGFAGKESFCEISPDYTAENAMDILEIIKKRVKE